MSLLRLIALAATAIATGLTASRKYAAHQVSRKKEELIEEVAAETRVEIRREAAKYIHESAKAYAFGLLTKLLLVIPLVAMHFLGWLPDTAFTILVSAVLAFLFIRDAVRFWPTLKLSVQETRKHGARPKKIVGEMIAVQVFDRVLQEATKQQLSAVALMGLTLAGESQDSFSRQVAVSVSEIARESSWRDLRPFIAWGAISFVTLGIFYSAFLTLAFRVGG